MGKQKKAHRGDAAELGVRKVRQEISESQHGAAGPINQSRPVSDPQQQTAGSLFSLNTTGRLVVGSITDATAIANCYRVQFEKAKHPIPCVLGSHMATSARGARDLRTIEPGSMVVVMLHNHLMYGIILCVIPLPGTAGNQSVHQILACATRQRVDEAHKQPLRMHANGHVSDWLSGRLFDGVGSGEGGWIHPTGVRIFSDDFLAMIGVDESCMLTTFYHDQLMRLAAYNLQLWTAGSEREALNDQGECNDWTGYTPYPWEQLGLFEQGDPRRELEAAAWQNTQPHYSKFEPKDDWQAAWHRVRTFDGYLGQGGKRLLQAPPDEAGEYFSLEGGKGTTAQTAFIGLYDEFITMDGRRCMQAAKGFSIVKRLGIVSPNRLRRPEQGGGKGDDDTNYRPGGVGESGKEHKITGDIETSGDLPHLQRAAGVLDLHAYLFNYAGLHPFFYHAKDYKTPQESELKHIQGRVLEKIEFGDLAGSMYLKPPKPVRFTVDHRYGEQDFYQTEAGLDILEDGTVCLFSGSGAEIKLVAGQIINSAPGDIWNKAGRNVIDWAGFDHITRAKNSIDRTATKGDIRDKSEANYQILAGNGGTGGVLIESRSVAEEYDFAQPGEKVKSSGIMLRAAHGTVLSWARQVYLRTGGGTGPGAVDPGVIVLDAAKGEQTIITTSANVVSYVTGAVVQHFGPVGQPTATNAFNGRSNIISGQLGVDGQMAVVGDVAVQGSIAVAAGHIATEQAKDVPFVAPLTDPGLSQVYDACARVQQESEATLPQQGVTLYTTALTQLFYGANKPGSDDVIGQSEFSLRNLEQYRTQDFKIYEDRWAQLARITGSTTERWEEKPVLFHGSETFPWPGKENFDGNTYIQQDLKLYDLGSGRCKDRGTDGTPAAEYAEPKYGEGTPLPLKSSYPVIR